MSQIEHRRSWLWEDPKEALDGAVLAALRTGVGRSPGDASKLWRHYRVVVPDADAVRGHITPHFAAEHAALTLYAVHQQSQSAQMHREGALFGVALRDLRLAAFKTNPEALDRRVNAAAATDNIDDLSVHLRGLVRLLRDQRIPLDYTKLWKDLVDWQYPDARAWARRRWGAQYYVWTSSGADSSSNSDGPERPASLDSATS